MLRPEVVGYWLQYCTKQKQSLFIHCPGQHSFSLTEGTVKLGDYYYLQAQLCICVYKCMFMYTQLIIIIMCVFFQHNISVLDLAHKKNVSEVYTTLKAKLELQLVRKKDMVTSIFINLKFVNHSLQIKSAKDGEAGTVEQILNMVENHECRPREGSYKLNQLHAVVDRSQHGLL